MLSLELVIEKRAARRVMDLPPSGRRMLLAGWPGSPLILS
jgi:hypothetical protein